MISRYILSATGNIKRIVQDGRLTFVFCLLSVMILPVYVHYLPPLMILWGLCWFIENGSVVAKGGFPVNKALILFFLFIAFFFWQIFGLFLTDSLNVGFERIFKRLSFLLFPLVLFYPGKKIIKNINIVIRVFAACTFLYIVFCFGIALHNSLIILTNKWIFIPHPLEYDYENYFYGARLSYLIHPSYLSMYIVLSVLISLESVFNNSLSRFRKGLWLVVTFVFLIVLYLLSSRAGILAGIIILPLYFIIKFYKKLSKWYILVLLAILAVVFLEIAKTNDRVQQSIERISNKNIDEIFKNDERLLIWKSALGVIKQNIIFGVGTGDASKELKQEFKVRGYVNGFYDNLNAHNQFLEVLLENGLIGLTLFLIIIVYMSYMAISQHNLLSVLFIILMIIFFMFETVLNRLAGITFFPMFSFLLLHIKKSNTD
jgi:O-antigen ligase